MFPFKNILYIWWQDHIKYIRNCFYMTKHPCKHLTCLPWKNMEDLTRAVISHETECKIFRFINFLWHGHELKNTFFIAFKINIILIRKRYVDKVISNENTSVQKYVSFYTCSSVVIWFLWYDVIHWIRAISCDKECYSFHLLSSFSCLLCVPSA